MSEEVHGAVSWRLASDRVSARVTRQAGMVAPVEFQLGSRTVAPYALAPWMPGEVDPELPGLLRVLRGDFFCLPFGPQDGGLPHGEPANLDWELVELQRSRLEIRQQAADSGATLERSLELRDGQTALYHEVRVSGLAGRWSYGNHPVLDASTMPEGSLRLSVSPFRWASVYPGIFSDPERDESQSLPPGARFDDLSRVPLPGGGSTDLTRYPARPGSDDLVMMVNEPPSHSQPFAWSAAVFDGFVWFGLKNPADFPATLFWISNGGRRGAPWSARHLGRIGIEEVCSHYADGVATSREARLDCPTVREFRADRPTTLRWLQGVTAVPPGFGRVISIVPDGVSRIRLTDESGREAESSLDWRWLVEILSQTP